MVVINNGCASISINLSKDNKDRGLLLRSLCFNLSSRLCILIGLVILLLNYLSIHKDPLSLFMYLSTPPFSLPHSVSLPYPSTSLYLSLSLPLSLPLSPPVFLYLPLSLPLSLCRAVVSLIISAGLEAGYRFWEVTVAPCCDNYPPLASVFKKRAFGHMAPRASQPHYSQTGS